MQLCGISNVYAPGHFWLMLKVSDVFLRLGFTVEFNRL